MSKHKINNSFSGKGVFPPSLAFTLLIPLRNVFLSPKKLIKQLEIKENDTILEIGPGPGYFSIPVARHLKNGKLMLADIQHLMLDIAKKRIQKKKLKNVKYTILNGTELPFANHTFDIAFMVTVLGEIEKKDCYIKELKRTIKNNGLLAISELPGDPDHLSKKEIIKLLTKHGFTKHKTYGKKNNFTIIFKNS